MTPSTRSANGFRTGCLAAAVLCGLAWPATSETLTFSANDVDANFHTQNARLFADDLARLSDGALTANVISSAALVSRAELKRSVQRQIVPIGDMLTGALSNEDPIFAVDGIPLLASGFDEAQLLWQASRPVFEEKLAETGVMILWAEPWPAQGLYTTKEINTPQDIAGARMRAYNGTTARFIALLGGVPTTIPSAEISQAFSTGVAEGMITSPTTGVDSQAWDFAEYFYDLQAMTPTNIILMNRARFDDLPADQQQALLEAARIAEERGWQMAQQAQDEAVATLAENGMTVVSDVPEGLAGLLNNAGTTMLAEWQAGGGPELDRIITAYRAAQAKQDE